MKPPIEYRAPKMRQHSWTSPAYPTITHEDLKAGFELSALIEKTLKRRKTKAAQMRRYRAKLKAKSHDKPDL